jgi:5'-3' exonuclease
MFDHPVLLVDFNNAAWRSAHALKRTDMEFGGQSTTVAYGILSEVGRLMERFSTKKVVLCGDHPDGPTLRTALYAGYKKRYDDSTEEEIEFRKTVGAGMTLTRKLLRKAGFRGYFQAPGYEADDLIAAFCYALEGQDKVVVSTDKDLYQLLDGTTVIHRPGAKVALVTLQTFHREYGIAPSMWVGVKTLAGCTTDKVPGLKGIGEGLAVKYLKGEMPAGKRYDSIVAHLRTPECKRDRKLVTIPFDGRLYDAACEAIDRGESLTEPQWNHVCKSAGIKTLPYPRC